MRGHLDPAVPGAVPPAAPGAVPPAAPGAVPPAPRNSPSVQRRGPKPPRRSAFVPATRQSQLRKGPNPLPSRPRSSSDELRYSLARRLTQRDRAILRSVARHRVLTSDQLAQMFFDTTKRAQVRLSTLHRLGLLDRFQPHRPSWGGVCYHYVVGPLGASVLAAEAGHDAERAARRWKADRTLALAQTQRLAHLLGINAFYASLVGHARRQESARLVAWLTEAECAAWTETIVRPDAFGEWWEHGAAVEFFLEYDRGTETLARLVDKLAGYERLETERGASSWVLFAFSSPRREATARRALAGGTVPVATAVWGTLAGAITPAATSAPSGPLAACEAVWLPLGTDGPRVRLVALGGVAKPTEALRRAAAGGPRAWRFERSRPDEEEAPMETP